MSISYRAGSDSPSEYSDEIWQVTRPAHSDLSQRNQQQISLGWETSQQNAVFYNNELWRDAARSSSCSDTSSPQAEQQNMTVWEASSQKAKEYMLGRQLEQDPIVFPHDTSPLDFISTSVSREHVSESSLTRRRRQNRDAQRAFRARERIRVQTLEDRLEDVTKQYNKLKSAYLHLNAKYQSVLEQVEIKQENEDGIMSLWEESSASNFEPFSSLLCVPEALHSSQ